MKQEGREDRRRIKEEEKTGNPFFIGGIAIEKTL